jgi:hypothetical protein
MMLHVFEYDTKLRVALILGQSVVKAASFIKKTAEVHVLRGELKGKEPARRSVA